MPYVPSPRKRRASQDGGHDTSGDVVPPARAASGEQQPATATDVLTSVDRQLSACSIPLAGRLNEETCDQTSSTAALASEQAHSRSSPCGQQFDGHAVGFGADPAFPGNSLFSGDEDNVPLSLSFIRKPSRSSSMTVDVDRIMKQNTLMNSRSFELLPTEPVRDVLAEHSNSIPIAPGDDTPFPNDENPVSPGSPLSPLCSQTNIDTETFNTNYNNNYSYPLIRKKSGELVKSSLKLNNAFQASGAVSLPSTPTYKQVHFGNSIAIRYFDQKDKPNSISADNSPYNSDLDDGMSDNELQTGVYSDDEDDDDDNDTNNEGTDSVDYYGFSQDDGNDDGNDFKMTRCFCEKLYRVSKKLVESDTPVNTEKFKNVMKNWNLDTSQFKALSYRDQIDCEVPVFLERCFLNLDKTLIVGQIAVKNISFTKIVKIRYSFDNWFTIVNVDAKYTSDIPRVLKRAGYDRFLFQLSTPVLLSMYFKTNPNFLNSAPNFEFCIKYTSGGQDFWDNNHSRNYRLSFNHNNFLKLNKAASPTPKKTTSFDDSYFSFTPKNVRQSTDTKVADSQVPSIPSPSDYIPNQTFSSPTSSSNQLHPPRSSSNSSLNSHTNSTLSPPATLKKSRSFDRRNSIKSLIGSPEFLVRDKDKYKSNGSTNSDNSEPNSIDLNRGGLKNNFKNSGNQLPSSNSQLKNENENILVKLKELELNPKEAGKTSLVLPMTLNTSSSSSRIINGNNPTLKDSTEYPSLEKSEDSNSTVDNQGLRKPPGGADTENGGNSEGLISQPGWKGVDSETYKDLLEKYCFFKGPSTVSSFLADEQEMNGNNLYDDKFY